MAQAHGDRLSAVDASFLAQERANSHMHVGAVLIFEGPAPAYEDFLNHTRSRLHLVPRYRHKLAFPPLETGRPIWIDDPSFNLEYHVRHTALPQPGSEEQLRALAAPEPGGLQLAARGIRGLARLPFELGGGAVSAATRPAESLEKLKEGLEGVGEVAWAGLNPAPATPVNVPIGPHRRLSFVRNDLSDFKAVKDAL